MSFFLGGGGVVVLNVSHMHSDAFFMIFRHIVLEQTTSRGSGGVEQSKWREATVA